jgi:S1-C subfamily serine protease
MPPAGTEGTIVVEVIRDTPAYEAGLQAGDIILAIDRMPVDAWHTLPDAIRQYEPGDRITVRFWRAGQIESVRVKLGEHPDNPGQAYLGIYFETLGGPDLERP